MHLSDYLEAQKLTYEDFGALISVTPTSVYRYAHGQRFPKRAICTLIEEKTKGAVKFEDFLQAEERRQAEAKKAKRKRPNGKSHG